MPPEPDSSKPPKQFDGKAAIVTGAAGGIGEETAKLLARQGACVAIADINLAGARQVADEIAAEGGKAFAFGVDLADEGGIEALVAQTSSRYGAIRILHNNGIDSSRATFDNDMTIAKMDSAIWDRTFAVNTRGSMLMIKYVLPSMVEAGGGAIINMSSGAAIVADIYHPAYAASKSAIHALTRSVATQYGKMGVRCNAISPGLILTKGCLASITEKELRTVERHTPTPRLGLPSDIAAMVAYLASDDGAFIQGQVINIDGGNTTHFSHIADIYDDFLSRTGQGGLR